MITDVQAVEAAAATYHNVPSIVGQGRFRPVRATLTPAADGIIVAYEGTFDRAGWQLDFDALIHFQPATHELGHAGFMDGAEDVVDRLDAEIAGRASYIVGHSLGAALALETAALLAARGRPPRKIFLFAPPRVFLLKPPDVLAGVPIAAWWFGNDPVPAVPPGWWQVQCRLVGKPLWPPRQAHAIANYVEAVTQTAIAA
jgi:pimeloyl-ACP methyl ester carboxylesterase